MDAIKVAGLSKRYGKVEALRGVDLTVAEGTVFGLVGPNGAGKTTLIKALVGVSRPSGGEVRVLGLHPLKERAKLRQEIGYMPQSSALYEDLSARSNVEFFGAAHGTASLKKRAADILDFIDLAARAKDPIYKFSGGMKRRVSLACALVHRPRILFLDEPTAAVDPQLRSRFWETFRRLAEDGTTLFVSTHLMDEAMLCDRVAILRQGRIIASDAPRRILEGGKIRLVVERGAKEEEKVIGGRPEDLAAALYPYGLAPDVRALGVETDSLERVVLSLIDREEER